MIIEEISLDNIYKIKKDWNLILKKSEDATFFQSFEWIISWIKNLKGLKKVKILSFKDKKRIVAVIPLFLRNYSKFTFAELIGTRGSDYSDFIILPGYSEKVLKEFLNWCSFNKVSALRIEEFPERSENFKVFLKLLSDKRKKYILSKSCNCYMIFLPLSWQSYLFKLSRRTKQDLFHDRRYLKKHFNNYKYTISYSKRALRNHIEIHQKKWRRKGQRGSYSKKETKSFFVDLLELLNKDRRKLMIEELKIGNRVIASFLGINYKNRHSLITMAYDPEMGKFSPGKVLLGHSIEEAIKEKLKNYDLSRGRDAYKLKFKPEEFLNKNITVIFDKNSEKSFFKWYKNYSEKSGFEPNSL